MPGRINSLAACSIMLLAAALSGCAGHPALVDAAAPEPLSPSPLSATIVRGENMTAALEPVRAIPIHAIYYD
jgi:hypothetical protein